MSEQYNKVLIIGGPNAGKTHFGGQLYGRLETRTSFYKITSPPRNLTVFKEVLESLYEGKSAGHTHVSANEVLELEIEDINGRKTAFSFPDYGGEQVRAIVNDRRVNKAWKDQIDSSDAWMLFIRADEIQPIEDIVNRGLPEQEILEKRKDNTTPMVISPSAFYMELIQMLLYTKRISTLKPITIPKLTVVLSCWDRIASDVGMNLPEQVLSEKIPAFYSYIKATWHESAINIIGLSSTEKTLSEKEVDMEYVKKGPEHFGYIITPDGNKERDLTLSIATFIGEDK
jgi:hypothetical protein